MTIKQQIESDLKAALLGGDKQRAITLRGLKSAILNVEIAEGKRDEGLDDQAVMAILGKEVKTRHESAEVYKRGGAEDKAQHELDEARVIQTYLPVQMDDAELTALVESAITETNASGMQDMGRVIALVKEKSQGQADGGRIAQMVKAKLA